MGARILVALVVGSLVVSGCGGSVDTARSDGGSSDSINAVGKPDRGSLESGVDVSLEAGDGAAGTGHGDAVSIEGGAGDRAEGRDVAGEARDAGGADLATGRDGAVDDTRPDGGEADVAPPTCSDHIQNSDETDVDCGGHCGKCASGKTCVAAGDCTFGVCRSDHTCGACGVASDCPGAETECQHRSCTAGICGVVRDPVNTPVTLQTTGDCKSLQCAADGTVATVNDASDMPDDRNPCTNDSCMNGAPSHTTLPLNTACGGLNRCNANGQCVGCISATDCPGTDTACQTRACSAQGICSVTFKASGTRLADPAAGDCKGLQCDGAGNTQSVNDGADVPVDSNACTTDECAAGTPSHRPVASNTACGTGLVCDGATHCVACLTATTCPGTDTECHTRTCVNGACGISNKAAGTVTVAQVSRDCKRIQCNGAGATATVPDTNDLPVDGNACTADVCSGDIPSNPALTAGTACGGTSVCDGRGLCVGCLTAATCPGTDTECHTRTCSAARVCGVANAAAGKLLALQTSGDCKRSQCDGAGNPQTITDITDLPVDGNACTRDLCAATGVPSNPPQVTGTSCGTGLLCNATGACVGCRTVADCPGTDTACRARSCSATGQCVVTSAAAGTVLPVASQIARDCKRSQCDAAGNVVTVADDTDKPVDGNACTQDVCSAGTPSNPPEPLNTPCAQGTGTRCNGVVGAEACVQCTAASQCPGGSDTECRTRTCSAAGVCGLSLTTAGTAVSSQTARDCKRNQCDGAGNIIVVTDATDRPIDTNACTQDLCSGSTPQNPPAPLGTPCSDNGGSSCNAVGACVGCNAASDCPGGPDTECHVRACSPLGLCSVQFTALGAPVAAQTTGDCRKNVCNGAGLVTAQPDDTDLLVDGNQCTLDRCTNGVVTNAPLASGATCGQNGGSLCNGGGTCVQCLTVANCDTRADTACNKIQCVQGACVMRAEMPGTSVADLVRGDCHRNQCDGIGGVSSIVDDSDLPANNNECASAACTVGISSIANRAHGSTCSQASGRTCDGAGACIVSFSVVRVGDGSAVLTATSAPAFIEERRLSDGALVSSSTIALPVADGPAATAHAFTLSGTATADGALSLSANGRYLTLVGYNAPPGTAGVASTTSTAVNRLIARTSAALDADTSTLLGGVPFSANNARSATTDDGLRFWAGGAGGTSAGIWFIPLGQSPPAPTQVFTVAVRWLHVIGGQLYGTSNNNPNANVFTVGTGLPTTAGTPPTTITSLPGMPLTGTNPFGFVAFDRDPSIPGIDTIYLADDSPLRGIQKWTASVNPAAPPAIIWSVAKTMTAVDLGTTPIGFRGLAGLETGSDVTLIATTGEASGNVDRLVVFVDSGSPTPTGKVLLSAPANATFRGVALSPHL
jgi:hypothetical protein